MKKIYFTLIIFSSLTILTGQNVFADTASKYNEAGIKCMENKDYENAVRAFEEAYRKVPQNAVIKKNLSCAYFSLATMYVDCGNLPMAVGYAKKAEELDASNADLIKDLSVLYSNIGYQQMKKNLPDSAYKSLVIAVQYDKNNWAAYANLGRLLYDQGKIEDAAKYLSKAVEINPQLTDIKEQLERLKKESAVDDKFKSKYYGHFEVRYEGYEKEGLAWKVIDILNEAYNRLGYDFQYYPQQKVPVIIYTKEQFKNMTGTPDWIGGLFDGIIRVTASDIEKESSQLKNILYHEYIHAILYRKTANNIPAWLNEGVAQFKEPRDTFLQQGEISYLAKKIKEGRLINLQDLDKVFADKNDQEQIRLAYIEAILITEYLDERYGFYRIRYVIEKLAQGKDIDTALKEVLYINSKKLEIDWLEWVKEKYK